MLLDNSLYNINLKNRKIYNGIKKIIIGTSKNLLIVSSLTSLESIIINNNEKSILFSWIYLVTIALKIYTVFSAYKDILFGIGEIIGFRLKKENTSIIKIKNIWNKGKFLIFGITLIIFLFMSKNSMQILRGLIGLDNIPVSNEVSIYYLKSYAITLIIAILILLRLVSRTFSKITWKILKIIEPVLICIILLVSIAYGINNSKFIQKTTYIKEVSNAIFNTVELKVFNKNDINGYFIKDNGIYEIEYPLKEASITKATEKINEVYDKYLKNMNVYYTIIPDKNYYLQDNNYLTIDYNKMENIITSNLQNMKYINLFDTLNLNDYYLTDSHWKQENLEKVVRKIATKMGFIDKLKSNYSKNTLGDFYGAYYNDLPNSNRPDELVYLTNDVIEQSKTYNVENGETREVYDLIKISESGNKYDLFLSGATPLITIENPNANTNKELIIFRDSFSSSLAPLFIGAYSKITLIDIRYLSSEYLEKYIEFKDQDVLFAYSTLLWNQGNILR